MCVYRFGLGWAHDAIIFARHMLMHFHAYVLYIQYIFIYLNCFWDFSEFFFLPPHSLVYISALWHQNVSLLCPETLFVLGYLHLLIPHPLLFGSVIRMPKRTFRRTFLDKAFIRNAESFCHTSPTLTYILSFIIGVRSHYVTSWSPVHSCWSRIFTPTCMNLILQYLSFYSCSRYAYSCHIGYCIRGASCPKGRAFWLP